MIFRLGTFVLLAGIMLLLFLARSSLATASASARERSTTSSSPQDSLPGTLVRYKAFKSKYVRPREVDVWLPPGYDTDATHRYPVLYMQDGQNLFDPATSYHGTTWGVAEAISALVSEGKVHPAIVVGIWNTKKREAEYMPQKAAATATGEDYAKAVIPSAKALKHVASDNYLKFMVTELKPFIDSHYHTSQAQSDTMLMGSSMGGLISLYAIEQYPQVFGAAACLSTHWPALNGVAVTYFKSHLPNPKDHRLYFDFGTETLDAQYEPYQKEMDGALRAAGYTEGQNWLTRKFDGAAHNEAAWRKRVDVPLTFLLGE